LHNYLFIGCATREPRFHLRGLAFLVPAFFLADFAPVAGLTGRHILQRASAHHWQNVQSGQRCFFGLVEIWPRFISLPLCGGRDAV
jgi:hypothetical protein